MPEQDFEFKTDGKPKKHSGLFKSHPKGQPIGPNVKEVAQEIIDMGRRLRTLEERYTNLQSKTQLTEQNMISRNRHVTTELKTFNSEVNEVKKEINEIKERILSVINELKVTAKKEEVKVLEKYINLWEPVNFVTRNEVEDIVREILSKEYNK